MNDIITILMNIIKELESIKKDMNDYRIFIELNHPNVPDDIIINSNEAITKINNIIKLLTTGK